MNTVHSNFGGVRAVTVQNREFAEARMHQWIEERQARAQSVVNGVMSTVPQDAIVPASRLQFVGTNTTGVEVAFGSRAPMTLHRNALEQMAARMGVPTAYARELNDAPDAAWKRDLLAHTLGQHFSHDDGRYLVRSVGESVRGFLSDRYRRIDCRPVLETLIKTATKAGAIIVDGTASDVRASVKAIVPKILEPFPGEFIVAGFSWTNSDYGKGANQLEVFVGRLACWNGMVAEKGMRQIHLGGRLDESIEYSERTLRLDTETAVSAVADVTRNFLSAERITGYLQAIASANAEAIDGKAAQTALAKKTTKATAQRVVDAFNGADVIELPPGNTAWRWGQAIALVGRDEQDADTKIDLERLAGEVLQRHGIAKAA